MQALFEKRYARRAVRRRDAARVAAGHALRARIEHAAASPSTGRRTRDIALVLAVEDNLVKGAAGQAMQNMNLMFGLPETAGLTAPAVLP